MILLSDVSVSAALWLTHVIVLMQADRYSKRKNLFIAIRIGGGSSGISKVRLLYSLHMMISFISQSIFAIYRHSHERIDRFLCKYECSFCVKPPWIYYENIF